MSLRPCPICRRPAEIAFRPFCSGRCRNVDLQRWLSGTYVLAGDEEADEEGAPSGQAPSGQDGGPGL